MKNLVPIFECHGNMTQSPKNDRSHSLSSFVSQSFSFLSFYSYWRNASYRY